MTPPLRNAALALAAVAALAASSTLPGRARVYDAAAALEGQRPADAVATLTAPSSWEPSPWALYNLGHAWRAQGDAARALASWRAAWERAPRDPTLVHDLRLLREELAAPITPVGPARAWMVALSFAELGWAALALTGAASALLVAARARRVAWTSALAVAVVAALADGVALDAWTHLHPTGVVVDNLVARAGPSFDDAERFTLPRAAEVRVLRGTGLFQLIEDGRGRRGWVVAEGVALP